MILECDHCRAALGLNSRVCASCGAPLKAAQLELLAGRRRARLRRVALVVLLLSGGGGAATWRALQPTPRPPVKVSADPYAQKLSFAVDFEDTDTDYRGGVERLVAVQLQNQGESSVACARVALRVLDARGAEVSHDSRDLRCLGSGGPLWPGQRTVAGFRVPQLASTERYDLVVEELTLGPPPAGAPEARPLTVSVEPRVGVADVSPFLKHELGAEQLQLYPSSGSQTVTFSVDALPPLEVTDLAYELRVLDAAGQTLGRGFGTVASRARADGLRLPTLRPGRPVSISIYANLDKAPSGPTHWQLFVVRFATRQPAL